MTGEKFEVGRIRAQFPALQRQVGGKPAIFLDGPAGSHVPRRVIDAMGRYLAESNANCHALSPNSRETDALLEEAHRGVADLLGTADPTTVVFGPNMTTLTLSLARALARTWSAGDEILVTRLEHDANFTPWVQAAADAGATVREIGIRREDCTLDMEDLKASLTSRAKLLAVGAASNAVGTLNSIPEIVSLAHDAGAQVFVDAVHYAPHALIDVAAWDCDYLTCSAYKFFGPHVGMLYGKRPLMEALPVYKLRPASDDLPARWETGTQCHEGIAGTLETVEYLADLGRADDAVPAGRREALKAAFKRIGDYEGDLTRRMLTGLREIPELTLWGIGDLDRLHLRAPTFAITHAGMTPARVAESLAARGIFVWHGNYYALPLTEALGLEPHGMVRIGLLHYNTEEEVDRLLEALREL